MSNSKKLADFFCKTLSGLGSIGGLPENDILILIIIDFLLNRVTVVYKMHEYIIW
jgi:hypothetical protein